jgi:hypothetical protein
LQQEDATNTYVVIAEEVVLVSGVDVDIGLLSDVGEPTLVAWELPGWVSDSCIVVIVDACVQRLILLRQMKTVYRLGPPGPQPRHAPDCHWGLEWVRQQE